MSDPALSPPLPAPPPEDQPPAPVTAPARRRPLGVVVGAILASIVLVGGALAIVLTRGGDTARAQPLALSFEAGQSETYAIHQTLDGQIEAGAFGSQPLTMDVSQVVTWRVVSVDADRVATIEVEITAMSGSVNGTEAPADAGAMPPVEIRVAPDGRILSAGGLPLGGAEQTQGFGFPGMGQVTPILPDEGRRVAPGDTWEKRFTQEFPYGSGTIEFTATSTYDRNEDIGGTEAAVIVTEMIVPLDFTFQFGEFLDELAEELGGATGATGVDQIRDATISYEGEGSITQTSFVDLEAKELLRSESTGDFDIQMTFEGVAGFEGAMSFAGTFTQELERR